MSFLLDDGHSVWRPASVKAKRYANRQTNCRDWIPGEILSIKDYDIA